MTQKQFKESLLRGQGRCIKAVQSDPDKYYSTVLWACSHEIAFDPQCEGTRAWFVYQLIDCYSDKRPFMEAAVASIRKSKPNVGWKILYLAELLLYFASDGDRVAEQALWSKYEELYITLLTTKRLPKGVFSARDDFAMLCQVLADNKTAMVKIAEDIGNLYLSNEIFDGRDFDWLFATKAKQYMGTLKKCAEKSENIAEFLRAGRTNEELWEKKSEGSTKPQSGRMLSIWLKNKADGETVREYAVAYLAQSDPNNRAKALEAFRFCPYPEHPLPVIEDAQSSCGILRNTAWHVLENMRHPLVREFAIEQLHIDTKNALPVFIANYQPQDEDLLIKLVKAIDVDFECTTTWHGVQLDVLGMKDRGLKAPASLLCYIYESTFCSCCRERALLQMGKRRLLTNEILDECLLDSNYDIRSYAKRCLNRRKKLQ